MTDPYDDPVAQYKEILDIPRQASQKIAELERRRTLELAAEIREADKQIKSASARETQASQEIQAWWREVIARMTGLPWIMPGRPPEATQEAPPKSLDEYMAEIQPKTNDFLAALRRAAWPRRTP
ncbi:hypothetical protein [Actinocrispum sp. NPDC049592]|uniref:hypothetical protein n=1 Tax=Actinocrispum sp. NPDC049592 TaxID=3154835 RepID=UPI003429EA01